jgi:putative FmdB family regulatory protein
MPTYEYACKTCGNRFETWQKYTDEPLTECPKCHGQIHRVLFPAGIVFKGSGFYSTDTRAAAASAGKGGTAQASDATSEATSKSTSESTSETKGGAASSGAKSETTSETTRGSSGTPTGSEAKAS